jgi:hypothetical protein
MGALCRKDPKPAAKPPGAPDKSGIEKIKDDVLMDLGLKQKDADYYSRLPERQAASQAALEKLRENNDSDKKQAEAAATTDTTATTDTDTTTTTASTPTPPPAPPSFTPPATTTPKVDTTYTGGNVSVGDVVDNRVVTSETEAEAIESTGKGKKSTIATSPKGLLGTGAPGTVRERRSLMGGGLIR